jgi:hypothetical protein
MLERTLARKPCPAALPGNLARQACPAALPGSLAHKPCSNIGSLVIDRRTAELQGLETAVAALHTFTIASFPRNLQDIAILSLVYKLILYIRSSNLLS